MLKGIRQSDLSQSGRYNPIIRGRFYPIPDIVILGLLEDGHPRHGPIEHMEHFTGGADTFGARHAGMVADPDENEKKET